MEATSEKLVPMQHATAAYNMAVIYLASALGAAAMHPAAASVLSLPHRQPLQGRNHEASMLLLSAASTTHRHHSVYLRSSSR